MSRFASLPALALLFALCVIAQSTPVTLQRLGEALDAKMLGDKDIAEIVLEVGVSFRLTDDIEKDLRKRGASDLVILAVRNGYRPPLPPGPATVSAICQALSDGASSVDIVAHLESDGVSGDFDAASRAALEQAGASPVLQRIVAVRWLDANTLDGSLDQIEALLASGATSDEIAPKLGAAPLDFAASREVFSQRRGAGARPALLRAVAEASLDDADQPLSLDQLVVMQGAGLDAASIAQRVSELGTDFETANDVAEQLQGAGLDAVIAEAVLARRIGSAEGPLSLPGLAMAVRNGVSDQDMVQAIIKRGVNFALTADAGAALASFPAPVRLAAVIQSLSQQGYRAMRLPRADDFNPAGEQGRLDIRLMVDHVEDLVVIDDVVLTKSLRGADSTDDGSELTQPLPLDLDPNTFALEQKDGRGPINPLWMPEKSNGFIFRARIFDEKGGSDRYHLRLTWKRGGANAGGERRDAPTLLKK
ncbi:MAG: hypothetical protein R2724_24895 [Bryobacterales bacterium]